MGRRSTPDERETNQSASVASVAAGVQPDSSRSTNIITATRLRLAAFFNSGESVPASGKDVEDDADSHAIDPGRKRKLDAVGDTEYNDTVQRLKKVSVSIPDVSNPDRTRSAEPISGINQEVVSDNFSAPPPSDLDRMDSHEYNPYDDQEEFADYPVYDEYDQDNTEFRDENGIVTDSDSDAISFTQEPDYFYNIEILADDLINNTGNNYTIKFEHPDTNTEHFIATPQNFENVHAKGEWDFWGTDNNGQCLGKSVTWLENVHDLGISVKDARPDDYLSGWRQIKYNEFHNQGNKECFTSNKTECKPVKKTLEQMGVGFGEHKVIPHAWNRGSPRPDQFTEALFHVVKKDGAFLVVFDRAGLEDNDLTRSYAHAMAATNSRGQLTVYDPNYGAFSVQSNDHDGIGLLGKALSNRYRRWMNIPVNEVDSFGNFVHVLQYGHRRERANPQIGVDSEAPVGSNGNVSPSRHPGHDASSDVAHKEAVPVEDKLRGPSTPPPNDIGTRTLGANRLEVESPDRHNGVDLAQVGSSVSLERAEMVSGSMEPFRGLDPRPGDRAGRSR